MNRKPRPKRWLQSTVGLAALGACLLTTGQATAEVIIAKGETWDAYVSGRVGAFVSYSKGEAYPVPKIAGSSIQAGGGVDTDTVTRDTIYEYDAMGMPLPQQGRLEKMRVRSGYYPNILTLGTRKRFSENLKLTAQVSLWGTIEPKDTYGRGSALVAAPNGTRDNSVEADFREGYLQLEGNWGEVRGGRFLSLFGRGLTEIDALYGHGYGVGFPMVGRNSIEPVTGDLTLSGPTGGMTGFGVLGATHAAGAKYTTPSFSGLRFAAGIFDAALYTKAGWNRTSTLRPEAEVTYDRNANGVLLHLFASAGFQKLGSPTVSTSVWGVMSGARVELGPIRVGGGGFFGKGPGVNYAFDSNPALSSGSSMRTVVTTNPDGTTTTSMESSYEVRNTHGFVGMIQVVLGPVDVGGGFGQTRISQVAADKAAAMTVSTLESQTAITAAAVYHLNESLHLGLDFIRGTYEWTNGESESLNVMNGGVTLTF